VKICTSPLPRASQLAPDLPTEIDGFFVRALARQKEDRFQSARELALAFTRIAPASYPSLTMEEPHPEIADILRRLNADMPPPIDSLGGYRRKSAPLAASSSSPLAGELSNLETDVFSDELPTLGVDEVAADDTDAVETVVAHAAGDGTSDVTTLGAAASDRAGSDRGAAGAADDDAALSEPSLASMVDPSAPPPPPPRRNATVRAVAVAAAAVLVGILLATFGNVVERDDTAAGRTTMPGDAAGRERPSDAPAQAGVDGDPVHSDSVDRAAAASADASGADLDTAGAASSGAAPPTGDGASLGADHHAPRDATATPPADATPSASASANGPSPSGLSATSAARTSAPPDSTQTPGAGAAPTASSPLPATADDTPKPQPDPFAERL
jgi:hypothetical protein